MTGAGAEIDWPLIYRALMHGRPRLRPWEIDLLSPVELALALDQDLETARPPSYSDAVGDQVQEHLERRQRMTPWEKLVEARSKW